MLNNFQKVCFFFAITSAICSLIGWILGLLLNQIMLGWIGSGIFQLVALKFLDIGIFTNENK